MKRIFLVKFGVLIQTIPVWTCLKIIGIDLYYKESNVLLVEYSLFSPSIGLFEG